ncbi:MAG: ankyrin repeat domain-containing protein [Alphaproteobacteria bacterium]|nr:ankyrin repeat domain-containing protein [Alphaproteobacteria bacterium]
MKFTKLVVFALFFAPAGAFAASEDFAVAAQLLSAAKNADIQQVQILVNNGANINYVDNTGLSLVCTALMNNDLRAAQILQMYGADASQCDKQIRNYRNRNSSETTGGFFGGLSTTQSLVLGAAGVAVVVGGLYLLTDVFDHDNENHSSGSSSGGHGGGGSGGGSSSNEGIAWTAGALPYGPAMLNATQENANYANNLALYYTQYDAENEETVYYKDFYLMNNYAGNKSQNYLLLMRGYSPLARGYLGMRTLRDTSTHGPLALRDSHDNPIYNLGAYSVMGGRPVNVALITANGVNAVDGSSLQDKFLLWTQNSGVSTLNPANNSMISSKYYNNVVLNGANEGSIDDDTSSEDMMLLSTFDLSNSGTAIHNGSASADDNLLGKIVGGNFETNPYGDFAGFMPNGQMTIYRTGGGKKMIDWDGSVSGSYTFAGTDIAVGDTMTFESTGITATVSAVATSELGDATKSITWTYTYGAETKYYYGYLIGDLYYIDFDGDGAADAAYMANAGNLLLMKKVTSEGVDYYNYTALVNAAARSYVGDTVSGGRSRVDIIANADVIEPLHSRTAYTVQDVMASNFSQTYFAGFIENAYGGASTDNNLIPLVQAQAFFNGLGSSYNPLTIFSTGASLQNTGALYNDALQVATFENAAPLVFNNLEHLFMSVVAVGASTQGTTSIAANSNSNPNKYTLAQWQQTNADGDTNYYKARICGIAGQGYGGIDPWCFASVGITDEMAVASAAGAAGVLRSAFYYMSPQEIFTLLALTADGPFLSRLTAGAQLNETTLIAHLQSMYEMPTEYQLLLDDSANNNVNYLDLFQEVFGYGVINLERATTPGTNVYYRSNGKITSTSGNAYWRAATNTNFHSSPALNFGRGAINIAAYDMLESIDGSMRLPRVWNSNVSFGEEGRGALYMGDVLGDLRVRKDNDNMMHVGNMEFNFSRSERAYNDDMGGLDDMRFKYSMGDFDLSANYQRYLTDGESRFTGMANPILSLTSRATTGGVKYGYSDWIFGARAFSGAITDEGLLANDPTISSLNEPLRLGAVSGAQSEIGWHKKNFGINTSLGSMRESNTVLGAYASGLLEVGSAHTNYIDVDAFWNVTDNVKLRARATFAHTAPDMAFGTIVDMSDLNSNAFALGADIGNFNFGVSLPLAVYRGTMKYDYVDYEIIDSDDGQYDLAITDYGTQYLNMSPSHREVRLNAMYRHNFGPFTDGAFGFIYRIHPNNTDEFGNESILMMKVSHLLGI